MGEERGTRGLICAHRADVGFERLRRTEEGTWENVDGCRGGAQIQVNIGSGGWVMGNGKRKINRRRATDGENAERWKIWINDK